MLDPLVKGLQHGEMPRVSRDGIEIEYTAAGDPGDPALLLVNGLGGQLTAWDDGFVDAFVDRGFRVLRFDNREAGLSSKTDRAIDVGAALSELQEGGTPEVPFHLDDMADDVVAVLDAALIDEAHVFGISMGGMIAQSLAIRHPARVASLISVMSTTGEPDVGRSRREVVRALLTPGPTERDAAIEHSVRLARMVGSPDHFEEARARRAAEVGYDRCFNPSGTALQLLAITVAADRSAGLAALDVPTLVVHGDRDPLIDVSGGRRTAELVPGAELLVLEGMGHDLPTYFWPVIVESVTKLVARSGSGR